MSAGKGDGYRRVNLITYGDNYEQVFRKGITMATITSRSATDLIVDIETLSTQPNAAIIEIAGVFFDRRTGRTARTFHMEINPAGYFEKDSPFDVSWDTMRFHLGLNPQPHWLLGKDQFSLQGVLREFCRFARSYTDPQRTDNPRPVWSHSTFDIPILKHAFRHVNVVLPWHYRGTRDIRTLSDVAGVEPPITKAHNALDDCLQQIPHIVKCFGALEGNDGC